DSTKYLSIYKGFVSSNAVRMYFHESLVLDLWQINTQVSVSHTIVNPKPLDAPFSYSADRTIYYCESPETLASRNIIIKKAINTYNYQDSEVLHSLSLWVVPLKRNTPYGQVAWAPGHDGVSSNNRKFSSLLGIWAGGVILEGNSQSVPYFLRNGFVLKINEENYTYYHMVETNQYINFLSLISPRNITNSPIDLRPKPMDDEKCCCDLIKKLAKYQGLGQKTGSINVKDNKIEEKGGDDIFPLKIPKRWIDRESKPKDDYEIKNMRHLILSIGIMLDRFEELFNPAGKDSAFPLKKPEDGIWKWLPGDGGDYEVPDPNYDPKKSKEDGKIKNKKLKIETYLDLFRYFLESQIRLEMLFPIAQIRDSKISKRLIYPKAKGEIKINDLIQFQELLLLYINKTLGDPSGSVIIKDADPTKEGDQPITIENFDISDMLRKLIRFSVDINSDIDLANNFGKRTLYQLLSVMQVLVKNHEMTEAIFEDLGMQEEQSFIPVKFFADPYAGAWKSGEGFDPNKVRIENSEKAIEENLEAFLQEKEVEVKVSRRAKTETSDLRDLLAQIGRYAAELAAQGKIPNTPEAIQQAIDKARFELQTESALRRTDIRQASAAGRARTKRNKKKQ
ncbi:MAG: hypothetical protein ACKPEN_15950, partial [Planktothrix sp.]|uniref:hypothetical protein n=2 Tax=Planktothrix sp. TaxID=3088171 RepID=UPI0038D4008E